MLGITYICILVKFGVDIVKVTGLYFSERYYHLVMAEYQRTPLTGLTEAVAISDGTSRYHPQITDAFISQFEGRIISLGGDNWPNGMPRYFIQGDAKKVLLLQFLNGDNWQQALAELAYFGGNLTNSPDPQGPHAHDLGIFLPSLDFRQDKRTVLPGKDGLPPRHDKSELVFTEPVAALLKHVSHASYVATMMVHNPYQSLKPFEEHGLPVLNVAPYSLLIQHLMDQDLVNPKYDTVVASMDRGGLPYTHQLATMMGAQSAINEKIRYGQGMDHRGIFGLEAIQGQRVIAVDDMFSSGKTTRHTVNTLLAYEPAEIIIFAGHGVLTDGYINNFSELLAIPQIRAIITTNSIPFESRLNIKNGERRPVEIPEVRVGGTTKRLDVIDVGPWLAQLADDILLAPSLDHVRNALGYNVCDPINPDILLAQLTGENTHVFSTPLVMNGRQHVAA